MLRFLFKLILLLVLLPLAVLAILSFMFKPEAPVSFARNLVESIASDPRLGILPAPKPKARAVLRPIMRDMLSGTGFAVNNEGYVVTNAHVVNQCISISVLTDTREYAATIVVRDASRDIAVLHTSAPVPPAPLQWDIRNIHVGDPVVIPGFPGHEGAMGRYKFGKTSVVATNEYTLGSRWLVMQHVSDHGNSGGPVLDSHGNVIGIISGYFENYKVNPDGSKGAITRTVDHAIPLSLLRRFLDSKQIRFQETFNTQGVYSDAALDTYARQFVLRVRCYQN